MNKSEQEFAVKNNLGLVYMIARKFMGRGVEFDDLVSIGNLGLVKAVQRFDESMNCKFSTYAVPVIMGEIKRYLRDDGIIKVSRKVKENITKIRYFKEKYYQTHNCEPTINCISKELDISIEDILEAVESKVSCESLYDSVGDDMYVLDKIKDIKSDIEELDTKIMIKQILETLDKRSRQVIILRYFKEETQQQIANKLGISQVQVSRIESKVLNSLKDKLTSV